MKLSGSLEKNKLSDILREIKSEKLTGVLAIKSKEGFGTIYFHEGLIIKAYSPIFRERLGRRLIEKGLISEKDLRKALMYQKKEGKNLRIGDILVKSGYVSEKDLSGTLNEIMEDILYSIFFWDGIYRFESENITEADMDLSIDVDIFLEEVNKSFELLEDDFDIAEENLEPTKDDSPRSEKSTLKEEIIQSIENVTQSISSFTPQEIVILVEDEKLMRTIFSDGLANFGYRVESYDNPTDALEKIKTLEPTRVSPTMILDLIMPGISSPTEIYGGLELLSEINQNFPHIPVIIITSLVDTEIRLKSLFMGASYFLNKPDKAAFTSDHLRSGLDQFVEELSLCVENIFRNKRITYEKDQLAFIREQLISELLDAKLELGNVEKELERDIVDLTFLKKTSQDLLKHQSFSFIVDAMFKFLQIDHNRGFIGVIKSGDLKFYRGFTKMKDDKIPELNNNSSQMTIGTYELKAFEDVLKLNKIFSGVISEEDGELMQSHLGGYQPTNALIIPFKVYNKAIAILYCDGESGKVTTKNIDQIKVLSYTTSLAMQITVLNEKISKKS